MRSVAAGSGERSRLIHPIIRLAAVLAICAGTLFAPSAVAAGESALGEPVAPGAAGASEPAPRGPEDAAPTPEAEPDAPPVAPSAPPESAAPAPEQPPSPAEGGAEDVPGGDATEEPAPVEGDDPRELEESVAPETSPTPPAEGGLDPSVVIPEPTQPPYVAPPATDPPASKAPLPSAETAVVESADEEAPGAQTSTPPPSVPVKPDNSGITKQRPGFIDIPFTTTDRPGERRRSSSLISAPRPVTELTAAAVDRPTTVMLPIKLSIVEPTFSEWSAAPTGSDAHEESPGQLVVATGVAAMAPRVTTTVSVAMDFARLSGGWAGPLVFNIWLRRQVRERRLSQRQLAALSGVNHSTISRLINDNRTPSLKTAAKLVHALRLEWTDEQVATYFDLLPERSLFPTQRVESALRGDGELEDADVRTIMEQYLVLRRRRRRDAPGHDRMTDARDGTPPRQDETAAGP